MMMKRYLSNLFYRDLNDFFFRWPMFLDSLLNSLTEYQSLPELRCHSHYLSCVDHNFLRIENSTCVKAGTTNYTQIGITSLFPDMFYCN